MARPVLRVRALAAAAAVVAPALAVVPLSIAPAQAGLLCIGIEIPFLNDCTAPESQITEKPAGLSSSTAAGFKFTTVQPEARATFACKLEGPAKAHDWSDCTLTPPQGATTSNGSKLYLDLVPGVYTFSVRATDNALGGKNTEATPATYTWEIQETLEDDGVPPNTRITVATKRWHPFPFAGIEYEATEAPLGYVCTLNGASTDCGDGQANIFGMGPKDYTFTVAAVDAFGNVDPQPARAQWTVPQGVQSMTKFSDHWKRKSGVGHMYNNYVQTKAKGATFYKGEKGWRSAILVVGKGPGYGTLQVFYKNKPFKKISLNATKEKKRQIVKLGSWTKPQKGVFKFEVVSKKKIVIVEGIGLSQRP